jgi:hypothetical protein
MTWFLNLLDFVRLYRFFRRYYPVRTALKRAGRVVWPPNF